MVCVLGLSSYSLDASLQVGFHIYIYLGRVSRGSRNRSNRKGDILIF